MPTPCRRRPPRMRTGCNAGPTERFAAVNRSNPRVPKAPGRRRRSTQGRVSNPNGVAPAVWRLAIWGIPAPPTPVRRVCAGSCPNTLSGPRPPTCRPLGPGTHTRRSSTLRHPVPRQPAGPAAGWRSRPPRFARSPRRQVTSRAASPSNPARSERPGAAASLPCWAFAMPANALPRRSRRARVRRQTTAAGSLSDRSGPSRPRDPHTAPQNISLSGIARTGHRYPRIDTLCPRIDTFL